jgi:hypothetical protein
MGVSPLIWRKKLMDSISGNLGYINNAAKILGILMHMAEGTYATLPA